MTKAVNSHGKPRRILSDPGKEFNNSIIQEWVRDNQIEWKFSSPGHHQTIGAVENTNKSLFTIIKKLCNYGNKFWLKVIKIATDSLNISFNRSIGMSPFLLKYGFQPILECDKIHGIKVKHKNLNELKRIRDIYWNKYTKSIIQGKKENKITFNENDPVLIYKEQTKSKQHSKWHDGYTNKDKISPHAYIVLKGTKQYRLNKSHLKYEHSKKGDVVTNQ
ncbi:hypothetical protein ENBRE01_3038 [Enteropsectra breve]|nr:hypothetical protein ENBRE01_3038 [Enteropsectra breve]